MLTGLPSRRKPRVRKTNPGLKPPRLPDGPGIAAAVSDVLGRAGAARAKQREVGLAEFFIEWIVVRGEWLALPTINSPPHSPDAQRLG